jgi:uncharacterized membrane protein
MWILIGGVLGAWLGAWGRLEDMIGGAIIGALLGLAVQWVLRRPKADPGRLDALEARIAVLEGELRRLQARAGDAAAAAEPAPLELSLPPSMLDTPLAPEPAPVLAPEPAPRRGIDHLAAGGAAPAGPSRLEALVMQARDWLFGGNTVVRVGLLVLFFGLAFLARYAVENSLLPVELRLAGMALGATALLALGWRLRHHRPGYALSLQGGGVGVLYLTIFAAMRLYGLLAPGLGFGLLLAVVAGAAALALLQRTQALAVIGTAGGFMAPILASTGQGDHVMLFGYYLLLNAGVVGIAWKQAWRGLNLTGFLFTFSIALAWGARDYRPELFATTEPFLIAFFLIYVAAAVLYAWHSAPVLRHYVDGTVVFGTPVVGFGLQAALVQDMPYGLAWSALAVGGFYVLLARALHARARPSLRLLVEAFVALGVAFLTLTLPLALDGRWTAAAWALEGAALLWVGVRQQRRLPQLAGLGLQLAAGLFFLDDAMLRAVEVPWPVLNAACLGALMIALAGFASARIAGAGEAAWPRLLRLAAPALLAWACLWWIGGGASELERWFGRHDRVTAVLVFMAASGALASALARRPGWGLLHAPALAGIVGMAWSLLLGMDANLNPAAGWGLPAWALAVASAGWALRGAEGEPALARVLPHAHTAALWLTLLALARMLGAHHLPGLMWHHGAVLLVAVAALLALPALARRGLWPVGRWRTAYLVTGGAGIVLAGMGWALLASIAGGGDPAPLPYLPLLNPLDLAIGLLLLASWRWWQAAGTGLKVDNRLALAVLGALAFALVNGAVLRAVHHLAAVPWHAGALFASDTAQTSLSLFWGALGLVLTFVASRRASRVLWLVGAALLAAVVLKLFLIDMASTGTVARIVSFLGAGVLLLVVGYVSPLPPAREVRP